MAWDLRHLRCLRAIAEEGTLTDAAIALGLSQAQVSRTLRAFEEALGATLVRRTAREAELTPQGWIALRQGRKILTLADRLTASVAEHGQVRLGYAWAAVGAHTSRLQRSWDEKHPDLDLVLERIEDPTGGLAEGVVDAAIVRVELDPRRYDSAVVGTERRVAAFAADDPWVGRSRIRLADFAERTVLIDTRTGTTRPELWPHGAGPHRIRESTSLDGWLHSIEAGHGVGVTSEATAQLFRRPGVRYRVITGAPPLEVRLAWHRGEPPAELPELLGLLRGLYGASRG